MEFGWINVFGIIIVVLIILPNMIYFSRNKLTGNMPANKGMNLAEQVGRYGSIFLMILPVGKKSIGFYSDDEFAAWLLTIPALLFLYYLFWVLYFRKPLMIYSMMLAILPSILFISHGLYLRYWPLILIGFVFSVSHIYITYKSTRH